MKLLSFAALALPLALVGCSSETDSSEDDTSTQVGEAITRKPQPDSAYTALHSTKTCKAGEVTDDGDETPMVCTGVGPYRVRVASGDLRERVTVLAIEGAEFDVDPYSIVPEGAAWSTLGSKAEWRSLRGSGSMPYAVIIHHHFDTPSKRNPDRMVRQSYLTVTKIVGGNLCLYGIVEATKAAGTANQTARDLADQSRNVEHCPKKVAITRK